MSLRSIGYGLEILPYHPLFRSEVKRLVPPTQADVHESLMRSLRLADTGSAIFGAAIYDLATVDRRASPIKRGACQLLGGFSMKYFNLLDDAIDDPSLSLDPDQKSYHLRNIIDQSWIPDRLGEVPNTDYFQGAKILGDAIRDRLLFYGDNQPVLATIRDFEAAEIGHGYSKTPEELLATVQALGKPCGKIMASIVEVVDVQASTQAIGDAAEAIGVYGMMLDHAYEVNADIKDGSQTVVTAYLEQEGDSPKNRRAARELCLEVANDAYSSGRELLSPKQRKIYKAVADLFAFRYKAVVRLQDALVRRGSDLESTPRYQTSS